MRADTRPGACFMRSSVPMTAPAYLSPLAPNKLPSNAVGVAIERAAREGFGRGSHHDCGGSDADHCLVWVWRVLWRGGVCVCCCA